MRASPATTETSTGNPTGAESAMQRRPGPIARLKRMLGVCAHDSETAHHFEDIRSLSNAELAVRRLERFELPRITNGKLTGTW